LTVKLDVGRIFPGAIILISSVLLLLVWIIVAIISFFIPVSFLTSAVLLSVSLGGIVVGAVVAKSGFRIKQSDSSLTSS